MARAWLRAEGVGRRRKHVTPGKIWTTDRRTTRRYYLFNPTEDKQLDRAFWYCLGVCAAEHGIEVHAAVLMSTHIHLVYTDPLGVQPDFKRELHRLFAHCVKGLLGWPEEVFNKSPGGEHEPLGPDAIIDDLAYLIANPTAAFAVRYAKDWPGPKTLPTDIGRRVVRVRRPDVYFSPKNPRWPDVVELRFEMPAALEDAYGIEDAQRRIAENVERRQRTALQESKRRGIAFKGVRRVLRTRHTVRARGYEVFGKINPRVRASGHRTLAQQRLHELRRFEQDYDGALARWTAGDRNVEFPYGTWWMRVHHKARVRPPP